MLKPLSGQLGSLGAKERGGAAPPPETPDWRQVGPTKWPDFAASIQATNATATVTHTLTESTIQLPSGSDYCGGVLHFGRAKLDLLGKRVMAN